RPVGTHRQGSSHSRDGSRRRAARACRRRRHRRGVNSRKAPPPGTTQLRVGRLLKAHGLKGAIKLELFTDEPERRFVPGATFTLQVPTSSPWHGKSIVLTELRWYNSHAVGFFEGVDDRTAA